MVQEVAKIQTSKTLPKVKGWTSTNEMLVDINRIHEAFQTGGLDAESARVFVANMRNAVAIVALHLDHAKYTKRLKQGSTTLEGFSLK